MTANCMVQDKLAPARPGSVRIDGWLGDKMRLCAENRVFAQDIEKLLYPFRVLQDDDGAFRCEFWGKWFTSAVLGQEYWPSEEHLAVLEQAVDGLIETQAADGYIGTHRPEDHLGMWDVWGRKYAMLGLVAYYDLTGDRAVLEAACRSLDCLINELESGDINLCELGFPDWQGLPPSSVLEPVVLLYQRTGEARFLDFANKIVGWWSEPSKLSTDGLRLIENVLDGVPVTDTVAKKAYEMMSCYEGICELYRVTGEPRYLEAVTKLAEQLRQTEIMVTGSGSNQEMWFGGKRYQTEILEQAMETCATVTWMKLCTQVLRLTGDCRWADELEISLHNALLGAMTPDGAWWAYYGGLTGERVPSHMQFEDVGLSCCVANGPRGLLLTPSWAVMTSDGGVTINIYAPGSSDVELADGARVRILQETDYPVGNEIVLTTNLDQDKRFALRLRVPAWSKQTYLSVNGEDVPCEPGSYAEIDRVWASGDRAVLKLDMRGRAVPAPCGGADYAVMRGPIVLALDNRLAEPSDEILRLVMDAQGYVEIAPAENKPGCVWMAFDVPFEVRPSHVWNHHIVKLAMCDFASAGNEWSADNLYRVWLPRMMFMRDAYVADTWKPMYPEASARPMMREGNR